MGNRARINAFMPGVNVIPRSTSGRQKYPRIGPHHGEVVRERQHRPSRERVALQRGDERRRKPQHSREQRVHVAQIRFCRFRFAAMTSRSRPFE